MSEHLRRLLSGTSSGVLAGLDGLEDWQLIYKDAVLTGTWHYREDCAPVSLDDTGDGTITVSGSGNVIVQGRHGSHAIQSFTLVVDYNYTREALGVAVTGTATVTITESAPATRTVITQHPAVGSGTIIPQLPDYCQSPLGVVGGVEILPERV